VLDFGISRGSSHQPLCVITIFICQQHTQEGEGQSAPYQRTSPALPPLSHATILHRHLKAADVLKALCDCIFASKRCVISACTESGNIHNFPTPPPLFSPQYFIINAYTHIHTYIHHHC
jgi:hypothetical protein